MAIDGKYQITVKTPVKPQEGILSLRTDGSALSGSLYNQTDSIEFTDGRAEGNDFSFTLELKGPVGMLKFLIKGTVDGDVLTGTAKTPFGPIKIEGTRQA